MRQCKTEVGFTVNMRSYVMTNLHYVPSLFINIKVLLLFSIYNILLAGLRWLPNPDRFQDAARKWGNPIGFTQLLVTGIMYSPLPFAGRPLPY